MDSRNSRKCSTLICTFLYIDGDCVYHGATLNVSASNFAHFHDITANDIAFESLSNGPHLMKLSRSTIMFLFVAC